MMGARGKDARHTERALATVLSCTYRAGVGRAIAFGLPTVKHFHIVYNYFANGELHTGEFASEKPIPQGTLFPIEYDPEAAHEHSLPEVPEPQARRGLLVMAVLGSLLLALAWWFLLHAAR